MEIPLFSAVFAMFEREMEQKDTHEGGSDYAEIVEIVAGTKLGEADVAHHGEVDEQ